MHTVTAVLLLTARFYSIANVPASDRATATLVAANILRAAGINVRWMDCNAHVSHGRLATRETCLTPPHSDEVIVRLLSAPAAGSGLNGPGDDRLGDAHVDTAAAAGALATVYVDRVAAMARTAGIDAGTLLGRVAAHEIGHLLLGTVSHRPTGLMRAEWSTALLQRQNASDWRLSKLDAANAREGVLRRARALPLANNGSAPLTIPCTEPPTAMMPATCPSCPVCATLLPADRVTFDLFVEPRF
jgi:hypothetical protein